MFRKGVHWCSVFRVWVFECRCSLHIYNHIHTLWHSLSLSLSRSGVGKIVALAWLEYGCRLSKGIELDRSRHLVCVCVCVCVC